MVVDREQIELIAPFSSDWHGFRNEEEEQLFYPFCLTEDFSEYQLIFFDWDWLRHRYNTDSIEGYYLNGHSIQALVQAARIAGGLPVKKRGIRYNSEGDCCRIEFRTKKEATLTAELALQMIGDLEKMMAMIKLVETEGLEY